MAGNAAYADNASQYEVHRLKNYPLPFSHVVADGILLDLTRHKFMDLDKYDLGYFITRVGCQRPLSALQPPTSRL